MKAENMIPYKYDFTVDYIEINEKMSQLTALAGTNPPNQPSDLIAEIMEQIKTEIQQNQLQFIPSNIYSSYATMKQLNDGRKNALQLCPGCGDQMKKTVQCQFCADVYCKSCCWRKRVIPGLSEKKDFKTSCQQCHFKFVKLIANQKFYTEKEVLMRVIEFAKSKFEKSEAKAKTKKEQTEKMKKCKTEFKIKQNVLQKQLINEEKKMRAAKQKLQQIVMEKAEQMKEKALQQELKKEEMKKKLLEAKQKQQQEEEEEEERKRVIEENRRNYEEEERAKQKQVEEQKKVEELRKKTEEQERIKKQQKLKKTLGQEQEVKKKVQDEQKQRNRKRKQELEQEEEKEKQRKRKLSQQQKAKKLKEEAKILSQIRKKQKQQKEKQQKAERQKQDTPAEATEGAQGAEVAKGAQAQIKQAVLEEKIEEKKEEKIEEKKEEKLEEKKEEKQVNKELNAEQLKKQKQRMMRQFIEQEERRESERRKLGSNIEEPQKQGTEGRIQQKQENPFSTIMKNLEKKGEDNSVSENTTQSKNQEKQISQNSSFDQLPMPAIKVSEMTVNELLSVNINPSDASPARRASKRFSLKSQLEQQRMRTSSESADKVVNEQQNISQQDILEARRQILRNSLLESESYSRGKRDQNQEEAHAGSTDGGKCTCSMM